MPTKTKAGKRKRQSGKGALNAHHKSIGSLDGMKIVHPQYGTGFWDKAKSVFNWVKDHKVISTVAGLIPDPRAQAFSAVTRQFGLGQRGGDSWGIPWLAGSHLTREQVGMGRIPHLGKHRLAPVYPNNGGIY